MPFTKYASLESAEVLEIKGSSHRIREASLGKLAEYDDFRTEDGYLYARIRAISSRVNKNHDGWPSIELAGSQDIFNRHASSEGGFVVKADASAKYGYSTFLGKPIFVDHHNSNPERARGVIVDAKLHVEDHRTAAHLDSYYASAPDNHLPPTWVELLLEVDAKSFPRLAKAIIEGGRNPKKGIDGFSMGCDVERSVCSICKNSATSPDDFCKHVRMKGAHFDFIDKHGHKTSKRAYEDCYGIKFFEISAVFDPADETALTREIRANVHHEGTEHHPMVDPATAEVRGVGGAPIQCPRCYGMDEGCPTCHGFGQIVAPVPGGDGVITPNAINPMLFGEQEQIDGDYGPIHQGSVHIADNPLPQSDLIHAPLNVDTLRKEQICDVCGSSMDSETCDLCGWEAPPEGMNNPDLQKAKETDLRVEDQKENQGSPMEDGDMVDVAPPGEGTNNSQALAHVTNSMGWNVSLHPKVAGAIQRPVVPNTGPAQTQPAEQVVRDQTKPITSSVRSAEEFFAAAGATIRSNMETHTADAASGAPAVAKPDVSVDVLGVGGVSDASNEEASKANAQIDVEGVGGTGVEGVAADSTESVDQGNEHSKNIEAIHTDTWNGVKGDGDSLGQEDPVTNEVFDGSGGTQVSSSWHIEAYEDAAFPLDDGGLAGGSAVQGVKPISETFGERVDVLDHTTSPENNSGPTTTWSGTDGNGVLRQQDPTTGEILWPELQSPWGDAHKSSHIFTAFKLADLEIEMGLIPESEKYARVAELEQLHPALVDNQLRYAQRVKTAGLSKQRRTAGVTRLPAFGRSSSVESSVETDEETPDSALFS